MTSPGRLAIDYWQSAWTATVQRQEWIARGLEASDRALELGPDDVEVLTCKHLLLRLQALGNPDHEQRQSLLSEADRLRNRARTLANEQASGLR